MNKEVIFKLTKERAELEEKRNKLENKMLNSKKNGICENQHRYLTEQLEIMNKYIDVLSKRINNLVYNSRYFEV